MQIPKSFRLGRNEWLVRHFDRMVLGAVGRCYPQYRVLEVEVHRPQQKVSETFWHEATHAILHDMNDPRWNDEKFVTAFSKRLNQIVNTAAF